MKAQEVLKKAKELLSIETEVEVQMAQATLENGTVIEAESMAEGQEVFIVTEDEKVALPVGDYKLEDGTILKVEEEGIIASIGAAEEEAPAEEEVEANLEEEKEEMEYATKQELSEIREMVEEIKAMIKDKEEMSEQPVEEPQEEVEKELELSAVEKVNHNPEAEQEVKLNLYAQKRLTSTYDRVLSKISNIKN